MGDWSADSQAGHTDGVGADLHVEKTDRTHTYGDYRTWPNVAVVRDPSKLNARGCLEAARID